jgi:hypothetical protein
MASPIKIEITFNNQEWIKALDFAFHDHHVTRVAYAHTFMGETAEPEQREQDWNSELPEEEHPEETTEEERKKKDEEKQATALHEAEESTTLAKRKGYRILVHGTGFRRSDKLVAKFTWNESVS